VSFCFRASRSIIECSAKLNTPNSPEGDVYLLTTAVNPVYDFITRNNFSHNGMQMNVTELIHALRQLLGPEQVIDNPEQLAPYRHDWLPGDYPRPDLSSCQLVPNKFLQLLHWCVLPVYPLLPEAPAPV
jgi:hypothetical protein